MEGRLPTFLVTLDGVDARTSRHAWPSTARSLGHDNYYSLGLSRSSATDGAVRIGMVHYNTAEEVDGLLSELVRV